MTAKAIRLRLDRKPKESTVRTVLRRLEEKGYGAHTLARRTFLFSAIETRHEMAAKPVKHIVDRFRDGSVRKMTLGMAGANTPDASMLKRLDDFRGRR